jgi:hypothetical protein
LASVLVLASVLARRRHRHRHRLESARVA